MYPRLKPLAALLPALFALSSQAAEQLAALNTVVVTATRQAQRASDVLFDTTVIEREEIRAAGPTATLNDLLARQPGVEINLKGGVGTDSSIFLRGSNNAHTLVLVDGIRLGSTTTGYPAWGFIPLEQVDRIEIVRGSCSSLYGSDAIGGVIQIFTKRGEGPFRPFFEAGAGTWNTRSMAAGFSGAQDGWRYSLQASRREGDSYSAIHNPKNSSYNPDKDGYEIASSSGNLSYSPAKEHEVGVGYLQSEGWNRYDGSPKTRDHKQSERIFGANVYTRNQLTSAWTSTVKLGMSTDSSRQYADHVPGSRIRSDQTQLQWQNDIVLPGRYRLAGSGTGRAGCFRYAQLFIEGTGDQLLPGRLDRQAGLPSPASQRAPGQQLPVRQPHHGQPGLRLPVHRRLAGQRLLRQRLQGTDLQRPLLARLGQSEPEAGEIGEPRGLRPLRDGKVITLR
jgi:vitamin B12 transporter